MKATLIDKMGTDLTVVNAARVSFAKQSSWREDDETDWLHNPFSDNQTLRDADAKLIGYLARHNHWTCFGHCQAQFHVKAPIFVARQLVKHQVGLVWNEVSRRYVDDEPEFWMPDQWRARPDASIKQGSGGVLDDEAQESCLWLVDHLSAQARTVYNDLLRTGVAPELARIVLPINAYTEWYWTGSLAAWARVCKLRLDPHAQKETRDVAQQISDAMVEAFPVSWQALVGSATTEQSET
ncbi:FAD-dependent thymidylate synthase [Roseicella sp. DB1501]|uniref:FAD-dependent thymidylate synthase n=1 Tax=Roseicella sp. DB1501 TaxID=2730925 RepID=UPI001492978C|nr:FAD-dependent thymidylate synthase [Roseicella sp. DB1501]NOG73749.1 FAD-dependent thymidylate synthase [Roseicella sp. DB1501]